MPLKDHKAELQAVTDIASLIKHQAQQKSRACLNVGYALSAVVAKKQLQEKNAAIEEKIGCTWGAW